MMVRIRLMELTDELARYRYFPEDSEDFGIVALDRQNGKRIYEKHVDGFGSTYAAHALKRVEEYQKNNDFREEDTVAWY